MVSASTPSPPDPHETLLLPANPATIFISYQHDDYALVERIERALQLRGVRVLRDKTALFLGQDNVTGLTELIMRRCDAIIFVVTPRLLASDFVWRHEVPTAVSRWEHDPRFGIIPVLHDVSKRELDNFCFDRNVKSFGNFNFHKISDDASDAATIYTIATRALHAAFALRLARDTTDTRNIVAAIHTFPYTPSASEIHLDVDWRSAFAGSGPTPADWGTELLPALADIADTVADMGSGRPLDLWLKCRLPVGVAIGYMFPIKGSVRLRLCDDDGTWDTRGDGTDPPPLSVNRGRLNPDDNAATIEIAISRAVFDGVARWRRTVRTDGQPYSPKWRVQFTPTAGISSDALHGDAIARAAACQISDTVHELWDRESVSDIHLFLAVPVKFAVMIGQHLRDRRRIHVYYGDNDNGYQLAYSITPRVA